MAYLAGFHFHLDLDFYVLDIREADEYLKSIVSRYSDLIFNQRTEVHARLEEGSLKANLIILGAIYIGIGQYGSFRSGIDYIIKDAKAMKDLVTSEIVRNGLNESDIIEVKRLYCDPDRIRRVLLAIDRVELKPNLSEQDHAREVSRIKASVRKICYSIDEKDAGLFASSIPEKYWPEDPQIPYFVDRYRVLAREEDLARYPVTNKNRLG